jgi:hypothetical protein
MTKQLFLWVAFSIFMVATAQAQSKKLFTRDGKVYFNATAQNSPEKIEAAHTGGTFIMDLSSGNVEMAVLLKGFYFEKALMQEHFNENYLETSKYPKASFRGKLTNLAEVDFSKDGTYKTSVSGDFTLHGVVKKLTTPVTFTVAGGKVSAVANFVVEFSDYKIDIPSLVSDKLAKQANISVSLDLKSL